MKIKTGFMLREVANNYIVVPVGRASIDFNGIISLNKTGVFLWKKLIENTTFDILLNELISTYDVSENIAKKDLEEFINIMKNANLLE